MTYNLRKINMDTDKEAVIGLLDQYLSDGTESVDKFNWNFEKNPVKNATGTVLISDETNEIVGLINQMYRAFLVKGKRINVGLFGDLVVEEKHRSLLPALLLLKNAIASSLEDRPLIYSYPNKNAVAVALRSGMMRLGKISRYANIVSYTPYIRNIPYLSRMAWLLGTPISLLKYYVILLKNIFVQRNYYVEEAFSNEIKMNYLVQKSEISQFVTTYRSVEYLKWRFTNDSSKDYKVLSCYSKSTDDLVSYAVYEFDDKLLLVNDIYSLDYKTFHIMLFYIYKIARKNNMSAVSISFLGNKDIEKWILRSGFFKRESERTIVFKSTLTDIDGYISDCNNWYILDGDEDQ